MFRCLDALLAIAFGRSNYLGRPDVFEKDDLGTMCSKTKLSTVIGCSLIQVAKKVGNGLQGTFPLHCYSASNPCAYLCLCLCVLTWDSGRSFMECEFHFLFMSKIHAYCCITLRKPWRWHIKQWPPSYWDGTGTIMSCLCFGLLALLLWPLHYLKCKNKSKYGNRICTKVFIAL